LDKRLLVVEDHPIVSEALASALMALQLFDGVVTSLSLSNSLEILHKNSDFALIMLDLQLSDASGTESINMLRETYPNLPIVIFSGSATSEIVTKAFEHGVRGFIPKRSAMPIVVAAIELVLKGGSYIPPDVIRMLGVEIQPDLTIPRLINRSQMTSTGRQSKPHYLLTPRQHDVYLELLKGMPNKLIADGLDMAPATVKKHLESIYKELEVHSRAEAVLRANDIGVRV
jgi:DNA-binding NarL/FixJ family response regulator